MTENLLIGLSTGPGFWMPEQASTVAANVDDLFDFILYLCTFFFVMIVGAMTYFCIKHRYKGEPQVTSGNAGNTTLELAWSIIPGFLLLIMFYRGLVDWMDMSVPPGDAMEIRVTGEKWSWEYGYPDGGVTREEMVVPVNTKVKLLMTSRDVLHSYFVPAFRIKRDVLPNRYTVQWFEATKEGTFDVMCTEYCGTGHSKMLSRVRVVSEEEYKKWLPTITGPDLVTGTDMEWGKYAFSKHGCNACHSVTPDRASLAGPALGGKFGTDEPLTDGSTVKVDEAYIKESILESTKKVVKGFQPIMPNFKDRLNEREIKGLVVYIKSLSK